MALRGNAVKLMLILVAIGATFYTVNVYMEVLGKWKEPGEEKSHVQVGDSEKAEVREMEKEPVPIPPKLPEVAMRQYACEMKKQCDSRMEIPFQVVSGAANIIGPSICVNGKWLMSNSIGNVNRGMNVAVVDGRDGDSPKVQVFDLYGQDSGTFKKFLSELGENEIVFMATFDDATQRFDKEARDAVAALGSQSATKLAFRDNWIFVGGKKLKSQPAWEEHVASDKEKNKFGNWPGTITMEGCIPKLA